MNNSQHNSLPVISIITKNGIDKGKAFQEMLKSTLQIPYKSIILIDDSSDERTATLVKNFAGEQCKEATILKSNLYDQDKPTRATGRQTAFDAFLQNFNEQFLIQLDDDVALRNGWWTEAFNSFVDPKVGLFYGLTYDVSNENDLITGHVNNKSVKRTILTFYERGRTNDIMLNRDALSAIREKFGIIPPELHLYEDAWLLRAVYCAGYLPKIGTVGAFQFDPVKLNRTVNSSTFDIDMYYIKIASKYNIIKSASLLMDSLSMVTPIAGFVPWSIRNTRNLGFKDGIKLTGKRQYIKLLYKWVKIKSTVRFSCKNLIRINAKDS